MREGVDLKGLSTVLGLGDLKEPDYERKRPSMEKRFNQFVLDTNAILE
jgi:hypothetical protein